MIAINVLFFIITMLAEGFIGINLSRILGLFYLDSPFFRPFQLFTHMFMHANLLHLISNMYALFLFGTTLERVWGPVRFLLFYFLTGFGAELLHLAVQAWQVYNFSGSFWASQEQLELFTPLQEIYFIPTVGASGAVFGLLAAFGFLFPNTELMLLFPPIPIRAKVFVAIYIVWELYRGIRMEQGDNVAHFAHLGGALMGYLLIKYWNRDNRFLF
ncbi:MAG: rhomboid family intramembrane serine protease [Chitinophagales bacterium]|nr:rhomboid family intramembrane serine protease [Chitinophagales bacterium]